MNEAGLGSGSSFDLSAPHALARVAALGVCSQTAKLGRLMKRSSGGIVGGAIGGDSMAKLPTIIPITDLRQTLRRFCAGSAIRESQSSSPSGAGLRRS